MALIGIYSNPRCVWYLILACNEEHYIISKDYYFINEEIFLLLPSESDEIIFTIHGNILQNTELQQAEKVAEQCKFISYLKHFPTTWGIYNFSETFKWIIPNNEHYEEPFSKGVWDKDTNQYKVYNIFTQIPDVKFEIKAQEKWFTCCGAKLTTDEKFPKDTPLGFRFGFWLKVKTPHKLQCSTQYRIDFFSYLKNHEQELSTWNIHEDIKKNYLCIKLSPSEHLAPLIDFLCKEDIRKIYKLNEKFEKSHTDIWIFIKRNFSIQTSENLLLESEGTPRFLMYTNEENALPYKSYHLKLGDIREFNHTAFLKPSFDWSVIFSLRYFTIDIPSLYKTLIGFLAPCSLIYAITHNFIYALLGYILTILIYFLLRKFFFS